MAQNNIRLVFYFKHGGEIEGFTKPKEGQDVDAAIDQFADYMTDFYSNNNATTSIAFDKFRTVGLGTLVVNLNDTCAVSIEKV